MELCTWCFSPSRVDPCVSISERTVLLVYVNGYILFLHRGRDGDIDDLIKSMKKYFNLTNNRPLKKYLMINLTRKKTDQSQ